MDIIEVAICLDMMPEAGEQLLYELVGEFFTVKVLITDEYLTIEGRQSDVWAWLGFHVWPTQPLEA
jgi:hypothetical protein